MELCILAYISYYTLISPFLYNLTIIDLGNNKISDRREIRYLRNLERLVITDLSGNDVDSTESYRLFVINKLRHLKVFYTIPHNHSSVYSKLVPLQYVTGLHNCFVYNVHSLVDLSLSLFYSTCCSSSLFTF